MVLPIVFGLGSLALRAAPYAVRGAMALGRGAKGVVKPSNIRSYFAGTPRAVQGPVTQGSKGLGFVGRTRPGILNPSFKNQAAQFGVGAGGFMAYDAPTDSAEQSVEDQKNQGGGEDNKGGPVDTVPDPVTPKKKPPRDDGGASGLDDDIKKGKLDDFIKERMDLFDKYLGDSKDQLKSGGFAALTEFGLNLATAKGGNLMDKIARAAKDPLKTFTAIGMAAKDRADKIKMAAVESGIEAQQAALDRAGDTDGTTFQKNLSTLQAMFTDASGELTIPQEDLINMAKTGATTSRKEFLASVVPNLVKNLNPNTGVAYTAGEATSLAEQMWSQISGQEPPPSKEDETTTTTTSDPLGVR